jgi:hypothetical protein
LSREEREQLPERKRIGFIDQEGREFKEKNKRMSRSSSEGKIKEKIEKTLGFI